MCRAVGNGHPARSGASQPLWCLFPQELESFDTGTTLIFHPAVSASAPTVLCGITGGGQRHNRKAAPCFEAKSNMSGSRFCSSARGKTSSNTRLYPPIRGGSSLHSHLHSHFAPGQQGPLALCPEHALGYPTLGINCCRAA